MKTLILMRHAKSSWKHPELKDHERGLNKRGKKEAPQMGILLKDNELVPQRILTSTAERSRMTAQAVVEAMHYTGDVSYLDTLYMAEPEIYLELLSLMPDEVERILVIGHNPGLEGLLQILSGRVESLPTSAVAYLSLPIRSWKEVRDHEEAGELVALWTPHDVKDEKEANPEKEDKPKKEEKAVKEKKDEKAKSASKK
ncbi:MAG: histidine phosphatase family protein [Chloroflexi bacterium]|nr:histidine phosphatase family protein [Chloroflexota bacterium]